MIDGIARVHTKRVWFVPDVAVWGSAAADDIGYLVVETVGAAKTVLFGSGASGAVGQELLFAQLVDHRGNLLPATLAAPRVIARPKSTTPVFVSAAETSDRVQLARGESSEPSTTVDLLVIECGN